MCLLESAIERLTSGCPLAVNCSLKVEWTMIKEVIASYEILLSNL